MTQAAEVEELEFSIRHAASVAKCERYHRRRRLSRPITGWRTVVTRGDDGWR